MNKTQYNKIITKIAGPYSVIEQDENGEKIIIANGGIAILTHKEFCKENLIKAGMMDFLGRLNSEQVQIGMLNMPTEYKNRKRCVITNFVYQSIYAPLRIVKSEGQIYVYNESLLGLLREESCYYTIGERGELATVLEYPKESGKKTEIFIMPVRMTEKEETDEISDIFGVCPWQPTE